MDTQIDSTSDSEVVGTADTDVDTSSDEMPVCDGPGPKIVGTVPEVHAVSLQAEGDFVYAVGPEQFVVLNVTSPLAPIAVGSVFFDAGNDIVVKDGLAFVSAGETGLVIIDISNPSAPSVIQTLEFPNPARSLYVDGDYAYTGGSYSVTELDADQYHSTTTVSKMLFIADIGDPLSPEHVGTHWVSSYSFPWDFYSRTGLAFHGQGDYLHLVTYNHGLSTMDVGNPLDPQLSQGINFIGATDIVVSDTHAFIVKSSDALSIYDISDPGAPVLAGEVEGEQYAGTSVIVANGSAYILGAAVQVVDVRDVANPSHVATADMPSNALDAAPVGMYWYVATADHGIQILDLNCL